MDSKCLQFSRLIFFTYLFMLKASSDEDVMPPSLPLVEGDSMYLSWLAEAGPLTSCSVVTPKGESVPLDPALGGGRLTYSGRGLSQGVCGIRVDNVTAQDAGNWHFTASGQNTSRRTTKAIVTGSVVEGDTRNISVRIDEYLKINCGPVDNVLYCELVSPSGELSVYRLKKCEKEIFPIEYKHAGVWKCRFLLLFQSFEGRASTIVNINTDTTNFIVGQNETDTELNIFCSHPAKPIQIKSYCSILPPNSSERISLAPGRGLSRFKFFGSAPYHCGVSIRKPLKQSEYGTWLCELVYTSGGHRGGFVHVLKDQQRTKVSIEPAEKSPTVKVVLSLRDVLALKCSVPNSLSYCWVQHPNGTVYSPNPGRAYTGFKYYGEGYDFGQCGIQIDNPKVSDSGRWLCGMGLLMEVSTREILTTVDVQVSDLPLAPKERQVVAKKGDTVTVGCGMVHPQAVTYCRFWKPDRTGLTIDRDTNTSIPGKYQYSGQGLHVGDCSLRVTGLQKEDFGLWICATTPIYIMQGGEITTSFEVIQEIEGISLAAGFGILIGAAIIAVLITVVFVYKNRTKLKKKNSDDPLIPSTLLQELGSEPGTSSGVPSPDTPDSEVKVTKKRILFQKRGQLN